MKKSKVVEAVTWITTVQQKSKGKTEHGAGEVGCLRVTDEAGERRWSKRQNWEHAADLQKKYTGIPVKTRLILYYLLCAHQVQPFHPEHVEHVEICLTILYCKILSKLNINKIKVASNMHRWIDLKIIIVASGVDAGILQQQYDLVTKYRMFKQRINSRRFDGSDVVSRGSAGLIHTSRSWSERWCVCHDVKTISSL